MPEQKPSIGRIVLYNHPGYGDTRTQSPAIIQSVNTDDTLSLCVFARAGSYSTDSVEQGDGPRQWNWPPRV